MFQLIRERRSATLLTALFVVCFTLMTVSVRGGGTTLIERSLLNLAGPLVEAAAAPKRWAQDLWSRYLSLQDFREENARLRGEVVSLRGLSLRVRELEAKVERLEGLLGGRRKLAAPVRLAHIVGRDVSPYGHTFIVDLGSADGVRRDMPVLHHAGVVGRISRVGQSVGQVLLLTDSRSAVDVVVQRTRAQGVYSISLEGKGEVRYMPADSEVKRGDLLISSGLGGIFPKGLPVAWVTAVGLKGERLFRKVEAKPTVDFNTLEEVLIMMVLPKGDPWK